ncbi:MAG: 1-phosphofructokinase family hexose kinase [Planctomycetes bacterium]|nr:1-phosphofructokinase family hexose kinase [Planctomycetota bacterium]
MKARFRSIVTVTLNPTIDRIIEVPAFRVGGHQQGHLRVRKPAGKAINLARALADLGIRSTAIGWVGMNAFDLFHEAMQSAGVKACFLPITGSTRENITIIDPVGHHETHIRDAGPSVDSADVRRLLDLLPTVVEQDSLVVFTGSLPPGLSMEVWSDLIRSCLARGASVAVDIAGEPLRLAVQRDVWLIKPNEMELGELLGGAAPDEPTVIREGRKLNERIPVVLVTMGRRGAYCFADGRALHAQAVVPEDQVRSTVGCGDAVMAGFLAGLMSSDGDVEAALREAVTISAAAALTDEPARFERAAVDRIRPDVQVRHVS